MKGPTLFDLKANKVIGDTLGRIDKEWFPGAPYDPAVFARFDAQLSRDIASGVLSRVESTCQKYEGWVLRKMTLAKLERNATP